MLARGTRKNGAPGHIDWKQTIAPDGSALLCLEDGLSVRMLSRHLRHRHGMTFAEYRSRWHLPDDYPRVAPGGISGAGSVASSGGTVRKEFPGTALQPSARHPGLDGDVLVIRSPSAGQASLLRRISGNQAVGLLDPVCPGADIIVGLSRTERLPEWLAGAFLRGDIGLGQAHVETSASAIAPGEVASELMERFGVPMEPPCTGRSPDRVTQP